MSTGPVVVIGGGVVGLTCAYLLQREGVAVVVCDRQELGREASWAGAGILSPLYPGRYPTPISELSRLGELDYRRLAEELCEQTGIDPEYLACGMIIIDPGSNGSENDANISEKWGKGARYLNTKQQTEQEPVLVPRTEPALLLPSAAQIRNPRLLAALARSLSGKADIREGVTVTGFEVRNGKLRSVITNSGPIRTDRCIVAAGAWSGALLQTVELAVPVRPIRGQMLLIGAKPGHLRHILVHQYRYLVPRQDGSILVGSTLEDVGYDKSTTSEARELLHRAALDLVPSLARFPIQGHWAGLRPGSPDSLPYIGEHPRIGGLFVCTGHHRNGFALAPATARITVDQVLGRVPALDPTPFRLDRAMSVRPALQSEL